MRLPETDTVSFSTEGKIASKWWKKINVKLRFHPQTLLENKRKRTYFTTYYVKPA